MLILNPGNLATYRKQREAFMTLFGIEPQVRISGTLQEYKTGDIVFLKGKFTLVEKVDNIKGNLFFRIKVDGQMIWATQWVRDDEDDFKIDMI